MILATRPLLMCLLREKLERMAKAKSCDREMVEPVKALLKTSYDSANKSLRLLGTLQSQDLLGAHPYPFPARSPQSQTC